MDTLSVLEKDHLILVPKYISGSTEGYLLSHGFTNVHAFDFNIQVELCENFSISFLKSGDFRDDSGFYVSVNGREFLLTVDANFLNSYVLPENIDVLMTSFASGASGFPLCYENYSKDEKRRIIRRNKAVILNSVNAYMDRSKPSFYMPYAGMFEEVAERDEYIKLMNQKNDPNVMNHFCEKKGIMYLDPNSSLEYSFTETGLSCRQLEVEYFEKDDAKAVIDAQKVNSPPLIFLEVKDYFSSCGFIDKQHLYIILTDDFFTEKGPVYFVDFNSLLVNEVQLESISDCSETNAVMIIRVREESLARVIREKLPWEDLSIGFQLRIFRNPNVYEAKFWYHFTNVYIRKEHFRYNSHCGSCNLINQNPQLI
jgi:CMP-N-acetylneuraminate monooxygenase